MDVSLIIYVCLPCWISSNVVVFILENLLITLFVNYSLQHHYRDFHMSEGRAPFLALCAETLGYIFSLHYFGVTLKKSSECF